VPGNFRGTNGPVSMLAKMGGRLISFYSDDLASLLLDDILLDTAMELQKIEKLEATHYKTEESKSLAENLLKHLVEYENEQHSVELKWGGA